MANKRLTNNDTIDSGSLLYNDKTVAETLDCMPKCGKKGNSVDIYQKDVNTIIDNGFYYGNELVNAPNPYGYLFVIRHCWLSDYVVQVFFPQNRWANFFYVRQKGEEWGQWARFDGTFI